MKMRGVVYRDSLSAWRGLSEVGGLELDGCDEDLTAPLPAFGSVISPACPVSPSVGKVSGAAGASWPLPFWAGTVSAGTAGSGSAEDADSAASAAGCASASAAPFPRPRYGRCRTPRARAASRRARRRAFAHSARPACCRPRRRSPSGRLRQADRSDLHLLPVRQNPSLPRWQRSRSTRGFRRHGDGVWLPAVAALRHSSAALRPPACDCPGNLHAGAGRRGTGRSRPCRRISRLLPRRAVQCPAQACRDRVALHVVKASTPTRRDPGGEGEESRSGTPSLTATKRKSATAKERVVDWVESKPGRGITEAVVISGMEAIGELTGSESFDALIENPRETFEEKVAAAMAEALALERPLAAGPIDVALACGMWEWRPRATTAGDWLSELDPNDEMAALPSPVREELVGGSAAWSDDYRVAKGWSGGTARRLPMARMSGRRDSGPSAPGAGQPVPDATRGPARPYRYRRPHRRRSRWGRR